MVLSQTMEVVVRTRDGGVEVVFTPLKGGEPLRDETGGIVRFSMALDRPDVPLAALVRDFARWVADLVGKDVEAQVAAIHQAAAPPGEVILPHNAAAGPSPSAPAHRRSPAEARDCAAAVRPV